MKNSHDFAPEVIELEPYFGLFGARFLCFSWISSSLRDVFAEFHRLLTAT
jgi:hypothetical protein